MFHLAAHRRGEGRAGSYLAGRSRRGWHGLAPVTGRLIADWFTGVELPHGYVKQPWPIGYYQTVYASEPGSAEMPSAGREGIVYPGQGWTSLVITPERGLRVVDSLLTGLHEPYASHLAKLEALAGACHLQVAYAEALKEGYLWHEFGDLHLILP